MMKTARIWGPVLAGALGALLGGTPPGGDAQAEPYTLAAQPAFPPLGHGPQPPRGVGIANRSLARIFTTLTHDMEWGDERTNLVRYERPISVGLEGPGIAEYSGFLDRYLADLRENTGIDIARRPAGHNLHIRFVGEDFNRILPTVSCLVAPSDIHWPQFARSPGRYGGAALVKARTVEHMTIFIPETAAPYLVRNCLLEEIAQALGTANDLYGLGDSIFNDDAAHVWPTALDYLMLRVLYSPELRTGLDRDETELMARRVLDQINPPGIDAAPLLMPEQRRMAGWRKRIQTVFSRRTALPKALSLAEEALDIARAEAAGSAYHCHSLITLGRVTARGSPVHAIDIFDEADRVCRSVHGPADVRMARIGMERATALLRLRRFDQVIPLTEKILPVLADYGHDERISALYAVQSAAWRALGDLERANRAQALAAEWGAYALGANNRALARWAKG